MTQKRAFQLKLKNDQIITLEFSSIEVANNQLWQMFATTEALDMVQRFIDVAEVTETKSARKSVPDSMLDNKEKSPAKKKK